MVYRPETDGRPAGTWHSKHPFDGIEIAFASLNEEACDYFIQSKQHEQPLWKFLVEKI